MTAAAFAIVDVSEWAEAFDEQMGTKEKMWLEDEERQLWLFKEPRPNSGEHWSEKIAAEVGVLFGVPVAHVRLAQRRDVRGTIGLRFHTKDEELTHGNELMHMYDPDYDPRPEQPFKYREHQLDVILECLGEHADRGPTQERLSPIRAFVGYLVLDALIGNVDRHHENWAIIRSGESSWLAPSYDHASSLGRELNDHQREEKRRSWSAAHYLASGKGEIYPPGADRRVPPLSLLAELPRLGYGEDLAFWRERLRDTPSQTITDVVDRIPRHWMSDGAKTFAKEILETQHEAIVSEGYDD